MHTIELINFFFHPNRRTDNGNNFCYLVAIAPRLNSFGELTLAGNIISLHMDTKCPTVTNCYLVHLNVNGDPLFSTIYSLRLRFPRTNGATNKLIDVISNCLWAECVVFRNFELIKRFLPVNPLLYKRGVCFFWLEERANRKRRIIFTNPFFFLL